MTDLQKALDARFTDISELYDIANHGIDQGISNFIYNDEIVDFYDTHEDDILDVLTEYELTPNDLVKDVEFWNVEQIKVQAVWVVVEGYACNKVDAHEEARATALPAFVS